MQLIKRNNEIEYQWKDVIFKIRQKATTGDKHRIIEAFSEISSLKNNGTYNTELVKISPVLIELFVTGWSGVKDENGNEVPWSIENLYSLPCDPTEDIVLRLGGYIMNNTNAILDKGALDKKKD